MRLEFKESFLRDLKKIKERKIKQEIKKLIETVEQASLNEVKDVKKIKGYKDFYRIKMGNYRVGIKKTKDSIIFVRILHRKDIYKYFP